MHHYNFPPFSVGETGFMRGPKRRDIGHGALAQRALEAMIPPATEFPYTIRIVSETLESNGSSSMGSVCGSTLALMDAGVPIKAPVSGIAMGLVKEGDDYVILTDIQGAEDHLGDMDFKVAGTREGITALQMDIKITGVTQEIMKGALEQANRARNAILDIMLEVIPESRAELSQNAPRITSVKIDPEKIGMVIGKGGETIRGLEADYEVQIDIEEDGTILIYATDGEKAAAAIAAIQSLTKEPEVGDTYTGKVVKTTQFGAFVELKKGTDGLLHVSNVGPGRVGHIEDVMARGDVVDVVVQEVDKARGRIGLKLIAKHENGGLVQPEELIERAKDAPPRPPEEERPRRDDRRGGRGGGGGRRRIARRSTRTRREGGGGLGLLLSARQAPGGRGRRDRGRCSSSPSFSSTTSPSTRSATRGRSADRTSKVTHGVNARRARRRSRSIRRSRRCSSVPRTSSSRTARRTAGGRGAVSTRPKCASRSRAFGASRTSPRARGREFLAFLVSPTCGDRTQSVSRLDVARLRRSRVGTGDARRAADSGGTASTMQPRSRSTQRSGRLYLSWTRGISAKKAAIVVEHERRSGEDMVGALTRRAG